MFATSLEAIGMPVYRKGTQPEELVTPKYSKAYGSLITGEAIEVGVLRYKHGEGAVKHQHAQEQMMYVLHGKIQVEMDEEVRILGPGELAHMRPNVPHRVVAVEGEVTVLSCKNLVDGTGHRLS
ncbi:cupin domain-containing protein [Geochorda subterranea]|uniref:Cupin domain-containing protein n=1 Tax=Geochorda subterranea TaxID=3109564 RepID=A0ABZ1BQX1_9FIRM|nr:cupin domain-containing protein [Limnochorda sp. LNt]WRP15015.1 cupin domain-containing protein [Limnochorda sp. LNt]